MRDLSLPNVVSLIRLPLAAAFLSVQSTAGRAAILAAPRASDFLDGWIARRLDMTSRLGEVLDPITDRAFLVTALATFAIGGVLTLWQLLLLLARDLFTAAAFVVASIFRLPIRFRARFSGKTVTALQILAVLILLLHPAWIDAWVIVVGAAGAVAILDYTRFAVATLRRSTAVR